MKFKKFMFISALSGISLVAIGATLANVGVARADNDGAMMLRQESASGHGFFHHHRSHRGGGLRGGK